ncbi:MotA/TolQ/ExbB proton channel family protein [Selenomonas sp. TAMA-11512]|uniref:MotA/TolQ/ExbB proton channel family protein n=1 Tax=Selenomonas sp. TAMA-11512 TaxID=3095337 RepID=UPI003087C263|nr:MotA/TolQ/ExbB proton channel family protein [Selenomonas sp. TAMA-11512]
MENSLELFQKGGSVMYALLLCSIAVAVIGIERFRFYRQAGRNAAAFIAQLPLLGEGDVNKAMETSGAENTAPGTVAEAGFRAQLNGQDVQLALDTAYTEVAMELRAHLNYLSTIVTLAPLLGLLGTISGMIESFSIFSVRAGEPLAITGGIGEALIATATGLCVAIFALLVHTYFAQRLDEMLAALDKTSTAVISALHRKGGTSHAS